MKLPWIIIYNFNILNWSGAMTHSNSWFIILSQKLFVLLSQCEINIIIQILVDTYVRSRLMVWGQFSTAIPNNSFDVPWHYVAQHDDVVKLKHFPYYWPFVRGIHRYHKGQWSVALMFSLICAWTNSWVNHRDTGDLRRHRTHYDVTVMN